MGVNLLALLWGFAEATLFFIVPDVWLSILGRKKLKIGLIACIYTLLGALAGGLLMFAWGGHDLDRVRRVLEAVPGISTQMIEAVYRQLTEQGVLSLMSGPLSGTPYKIYASQAQAAGISPWVFLLVSIPARLIRFVLVTSVLHYAHEAACRLMGKKDCLGLLLFGWLLFYVFYFYVI